MELEDLIISFKVELDRLQTCSDPREPLTLWHPGGFGDFRKKNA